MSMIALIFQEEETGMFITRLFDKRTAKERVNDTCLDYNAAVDFASSRGGEIVWTCMQDETQTD